MADVLLLKLLLVPGLVAAVTLAVRRWGPAVGGWLAGLPIVAGPVLVFYALEQGNTFAASAAHATLAGLVATVAFVVVYARCSVRLPWYVSVAVGWTAFAAAIVFLYRVQPTLVQSLLSLIVATVLARRALPQSTAGRKGPPYVPEVTDRQSSPDGVANPPGDLAVRIVATATLVLVLTGLAERFGATLSGLLNAFPVLTTIIAAFTHAQRGPAAVAAFLDGYLQAVVGFALFCVVMALALDPLGLSAALTAALAAQLVAQGILLWRTSRFSWFSG